MGPSILYLGLNPFWVAIAVGAITFPINPLLRFEGSTTKAGTNIVVFVVVVGLTIFGWLLTSHPWNWFLFTTMFLMAYGLNRLLDTVFSLPEDWKQ